MVANNPQEAERQTAVAAETVLDERQEKIARESAELKARAEATDPAALTSTKERVAYILNHYPETRDSDIKLYFQFWRIFHFDVIGGGEEVGEADLLQVERPTALTRLRAKIQNEYQLYQASPEVQEFRVGRRRDMEDEAVKDKPGHPYVFVYCDESGKNQEYAVVGSMWMYSGFQAGGFARDMFLWKEKNGVAGEFHFAELTKATVDTAKAFFAEVVKRSDFIGFKAVATRQKGSSRKPADLIERLYVELVRDGLEHDLSHNRITIPRTVQVVKDKEDGMDEFSKRDLEDRITTLLKAAYNDGIDLDDVRVEDSKGDVYIQLADLFTGAVNRMLNPAQSRNHKDEFAEYILGLLGLEITPGGVKHVGGQDAATVIFV